MGEFWDIALDVLLDAVEDTLYLVPFLFVTYLIMEWLEHKTGDKVQQAVRRAGAAGPAVGAVLGAVPQCGFSAVAATLYAGRVISLGTLFAVFLSTSDEMLPVFIAQQVPIGTILGVLGAKIAIGMAMGFAIDAVMRLLHRSGDAMAIHDLCEQDGCHCHDEEGGGILKSAIVHTLQVTLFIFLVTLVLDALIAAVGEDAIGSFLGGNEVLSVFASALVGLIPNCAASVIIAQLYLDGMLGSGALIAGLLVSSGVGLLVLLRSNRHAKQNAGIVVGLYAAGVFWGLVVNALGLTF